MARTVKEWVGRTDDAMPSSEASLRIWHRAKGRCQHCERKILAGEPKHRDHIKPLADGGKNVESNFQILCEACHRLKTGAENSERAKVKAKAKSILGLRTTPVQKIQSGPRTISERTARKIANPKPSLAPRQLFRSAQETQP